MLWMPGTSNPLAWNYSTDDVYTVVLCFQYGLFLNTLVYGHCRSPRLFFRQRNIQTSSMDAYLCFGLCFYHFGYLWDMFMFRAQNILSYYNNASSISLIVAFPMYQNTVHDTILRVAKGGTIVGMNVNTLLLSSQINWSHGRATV